MNIVKRSLWKTTHGLSETGSDSADILIVGNGIAGLTAALEARRLDPSRRVTIVTEQSHPTIHTPALKQFAIGKLSQEQLLAHPAGTERRASISILNARVESIQSKENSVRLSNGQEMGYQSLLLATGSRPAGLPSDMPGRDFDGVLTLHRLGDYLNLRRRLRLHEVKEAVVIGGGTHAIETVMALLHWGVRVHWLIRGATFLSHVLDQTASDIVLERVRAAGASVSTSTRVAGIVGKVGIVAGVITHDQQILPCQLVVACTGTTPETTLAERCDIPLKHKHGIFVDDHLRTSAPSIFAAGDVAALQNPQTGVYQTRPYWQTAAAQGRLAAAVMTGHSELATSPGTPWHATQLGELALLVVGDPLRNFEGATTITDNRKGSYRRLSISGNRLISYLSVGATQPDSLAIKRIIDEGRSVQHIEKALLAGELDLRHYSALSASSTAQRIATTGELPVIHVPRPTVDLSQDIDGQHNTEPLPRISAPLPYTERNTGDDADMLMPSPITRKLTVAPPSPAIGSVRALMSKQRERWIIPGILPQGLVALVGRHKVGKSWFDLSLGMGIASQGTGIGNVSAEKGSVLYLALEENEQRLQERLSTLEAHGAALSDDFEYATSWPRMDSKGIASLESWLFTHPRARLVMIDTWETVRPSDLSDDAKVVADTESLAALRSLAETYSVSILLSFHTPKTRAGTPLNALKATTSIADHADGVLHLKRAHGSSKASLALHKVAFAQPTTLTLSFNDGCWNMDAIPDNMPIPAFTGAQRELFETLRQNRQPVQEPEEPEEVPVLVLNRLY